MSNQNGVGATIAPGQFSGPNQQEFRYWTPIGGTGTPKASITIGTVCVPDLRQRAAYNNGTATRAAVGGTPNYNASTGDASGSYNVTVVNDGSTPAPATRTPFVAVLTATPDGGALANGQAGVFTMGGFCRARVSGAVNRGDRLALDVTNNTNAGFFKVAAANETVWAIAQETIGAAGVVLVELVPPSQATTAGNA